MRHCSKDVTFDGDKLIAAKPSVPLISRSLASASLVANIVANKFELALPLDRQRHALSELGLVVSETTICNWVTDGAKWVTNLSDHLLTMLKSQTHVHGDETPIQVLREPGKSPTSKSYLWLMRSIEQAEQPIIHFHYAPSRSEAVATKLYTGFSGTLLCDGYSGYDCAGCWAHCRRKFFEAKNGAESRQSRSQEIVSIIDQMFGLEAQLKDLKPSERLTQRRGLIQPLFDQFWSLVENTQAMPKTKLGRAITYAVNQRNALGKFLNDPQIALSNNIAERSIKHTVIGRKNWLFSTSQKGAKANAVFLGLCETAKANGLNVRKYLVLLFEKLPQLGEFPTNDELEAYLPWNLEVQRRCRAEI